MKGIIFILCLIFSLRLTAQNPNIKRTWHWYFGYGAGIDFSTGSAVADTNGQLHTYEGTAAISDTVGDLLFYTDGDSVWDRNHNIMPNGYGLFGCGNFGSTSQATVIIPYPNHNNQYLIITNDCAANSGVSGLCYTVVNMLLNSGNGDVDTNQKNVLLFAAGTEGLAVTYQCNKNFYWIVAHEYNNNNFRVYSLDSNGINLVPQIISIGSTYTHRFSMLKFSSDGRKLATTYRHFATYDLAMLFDFNTQSGLITNGIQLTGFLSGGIYSPEFSIDNTKLYYNDANTDILQYDIQSGVDTIINNSRIIVSHNSNSSYGYFQKAPDGKIYIATYNADSLSTIEAPNINGIGCNVNPMSFYLARNAWSGVPCFVADYFFQGPMTTSCDTSGISDRENVDIKIFPNPATDCIYIEGEDIYSVSLFNILGNIIYWGNMRSFEGQQKLNISPINPGIYLLKIETKNKIITKKIFIN